MDDKLLKVIYIINYAPNYRHVFLQELGKFCDLTVVSFNGKNANLQDPENRDGYNFIELKQKRLLNISFQLKEFTLCNDKYDVIIVGYNLRNPFRMLNVFRNQRVILEGLIYGKNENFFIRFFRHLFIKKSEGVLVYSKMVEDKLKQEIKNKPIISFNNSSYSLTDIDILEKNEVTNELNILWIGRFQKRKKIDRLIDIASKYDFVKVRLIGPGIKENLKAIPSNVEILGPIYDQDLKSHFEWSHAVFNPGGAGLLTMNAARFGRPIFIDNNSHHGPEIQLAIDGNQYFLDFSDDKLVEDLVFKCKNTPNYMQNKGIELATKMENYTIEFMAKQYMKSINKNW